MVTAPTPARTSAWSAAPPAPPAPHISDARLAQQLLIGSRQEAAVAARPSPRRRRRSSCSSRRSSHVGAALGAGWRLLCVERGGLPFMPAPSAPALPPPTLLDRRREEQCPTSPCAVSRSCSPARCSPAARPRRRRRPGVPSIEPRRRPRRRARAAGAPCSTASTLAGWHVYHETARPPTGPWWTAPSSAWPTVADLVTDDLYANFELDARLEDHARREQRHPI